MGWAPLSKINVPLLSVSASQTTSTGRGGGVARLYCMAVVVCDAPDICKGVTQAGLAHSCFEASWCGIWGVCSPEILVQYEPRVCRVRSESGMVFGRVVSGVDCLGLNDMDGMHGFDTFVHVSHSPQ